VRTFADKGKGDSSDADSTLFGVRTDKERGELNQCEHFADKGGQFFAILCGRRLYTATNELVCWFHSPPRWSRTLNWCLVCRFWFLANSRNIRSLFAIFQFFYEINVLLLQVSYSPDSTSLDDCLRAFTKEETLDRDEKPVSLSVLNAHTLFHRNTLQLAFFSHKTVPFADCWITRPFMFPV